MTEDRISPYQQGIVDGISDKLRVLPDAWSTLDIAGYDTGYWRGSRIRKKHLSSRLVQGDLFTDPCRACGGSGDMPGVSCSDCKGTGFAGRHAWAI